MREKYRCQNIVENSISNEEDYCEGILMTTSGFYIMGVNLAVSKVKSHFSYPGSDLLDRINAFDSAETAAALVGQINAIEVSSFCGPKGLIWGYHLAKVEHSETKCEIESVKWRERRVPIYSADSLVKALCELFGTVDKPRFPLLPGSHVPCAMKKMTIAKKAGVVFSTIGIGMASEPVSHANLLMEDVGFVRREDLPRGSFEEIIKPQIIENVAKSIIQIGLNQRVEYKEIYVGIRSTSLEEDEIGCALVICPYFLLAKKAITAPIDTFSEMSLATWLDSLES